MNIKNILNKFIDMDGAKIIYCNKLSKKEYNLLINNGYKLKLINYTWIKKPYYELIQQNL